MGIQGLLSYCFAHKQRCIEFVDLVQIAEERNGIEILVDFNSFAGKVSEKFMAYLQNSTGNKYLMILGAENKTIDAYVEKLVAVLSAANITLVWYVDGGKASTIDHLNSKLPEWTDRHHKTTKKIHEVMKVCAGEREMVPHNELIRPVMLTAQIRATLTKLNSEVIQCTSGEADDCIAKALLDRPNAYAILTNDSDFCVFKDCHFLPDSLFDIDNDLKMDQAGFLVNRPLLSKLNVGIIVASKLLEHFQFPTHQHMVELSILKGNDYTKSLLSPDLYHCIGLHKYRDIDEVAKFIGRIGGLRNSIEFSNLQYKNPKLAAAVRYSYQFYTFQLCDQPQHTHRNRYEQFLHQMIAEQNFNTEVISMFNQFYWRRQVMEDLSPGYPCVEIALTPLRQFMYRMVLPFGKEFVTEYGRAPYEDLTSQRIYPYDPNDKNVPFVRDVKKQSFLMNIRTFNYIMSHLETPGQGQKFLQLYGRKNGFISTLLRYFLLLNLSSNLCLTREEFLALVATALTHHKPERQYQELCIQPLPRTVTIATWFLDLYKHAYIFLGGLLYVKDEFPIPSEFFSGSMWIAYHSCTNEQAYYRAMKNVPERKLFALRQEIDNCLYEKRHQISKLVSPFFPFNGCL